MSITNAKTAVREELYRKKALALHLIASFTVSRVFLAGCVSPFSMAYLCSFMCTKEKSGAKTVLTVAAFVVGILSTSYRGAVLRYLLSYVLFGIIYISASSFGKKRGFGGLCAAGAAANAVSGTIYCAQLENPLNNLAAVAVESAACFLLSFAIKPCASLIFDENGFDDVKKEDVTGICLLSAAFIAGFFGTHIGNFSVGKALLGVCIMIISFCGGASSAAACGVGLGILNSLYSFEFNDSAGVFGFCALVCGGMKRLGRPGVIFGFALSSKLISLYFGGWSDSVLSDFEVVAAVCAFCLVPYSVLVNIRMFFEVNLRKSEETGRILEMLGKKMKNISETFDKLSDVTAELFEKTPPNTADISTVYEMTADKVCKNCGLKFICWEREAFDTRDALNKLTVVLQKSGSVSAKNIPDKFGQKCIKSDVFVNELNRVFTAFKTDDKSRERINCGQKLISRQFGEMADVVGNITSDIGKSIMFDKAGESRIYAALEKERIFCSDVTAVRDSDGILKVSMRIKARGKGFTDIVSVAENAVSRAVGKSMAAESYFYKKKNFFVKLVEKERFSVTCSCRSIPKGNETVCGDNIVCGNISGGRYAAVLSDGMGSGSNAAKISHTATELFVQFLNAGFEKSNSLDIIGSALMLGSSETFATIDAVTVDLHTGVAEFTKAGANTSYIKTAGKIRKISSTSLPVGILDATAADTFSYNARENDIIVLISDGIQSAADNWFEEYLLNMHEENPNIISELLLNEAKRRKKQDDDMTVAVMKIMKN